MTEEPQPAGVLEKTRSWVQGILPVEFCDLPGSALHRRSFAHSISLQPSGESAWLVSEENPTQQPSTAASPPQNLRKGL